MKKQFLHTVLITIMMGALSCAHACDQFIDHLQQDLSQGKKLTLSRAELEEYVAHFPEMKPLVPAELYDKSLCSHDYDYEKLEIIDIWSDKTIIYLAISSEGYSCMDGRISKDFIQGYLSYQKKPSYAFDANQPVPVVNTNASVVPVVILSPVEQQIADLRALPMTRTIRLQIAKLEHQLGK